MMLAMAPITPSLLDSVLVDRLLAPRHGAFALSGEAPHLSEHAGDGTYALTVAAPGVATSDLTVSVENDVVKIDGETVTVTHTHVVHWQTRLPRDADTEQATVSHADGLITVSIPKKLAAEPTKIVVKAFEDDVTTTGGDSDAVEPKHYQITLTAPGISASDLNIVAEESVLRVVGESARTGARLERSFRLPRDADAASTSAAHLDGILTMSIPKKPMEDKAKTLVVNAEGTTSR